MGRAEGRQIEDPGSSPATANFFNFFNFFIFRICGSSAFAEGGIFFGKKYLRILLNKYYINYRCDRHYAEDLRPPHYWQTDSNYGSLRIHLIISSTLTCLDPTMVHFSEPRTSLASNLEVSRVERPPREPKRTAAKEKRTTLRSSMPAGGQPGSY